MKVTWEVDDGYAGPSAPHTTMIDDDDLAEYQDEKEREDFIRDCIEEEFSQEITWYETGRE